MSTGVERLDSILGGGVYRGSTTLVSGTAGTGKTIVVARAVEAACQRGERCLYVSFEESPDQLVRNMRSVGIDLARWVDAGRLRIWAGRPSMYGLETHLAFLLRELDEMRPSVVALDSLAALFHAGEPSEVVSVMTREIDVLKARGVTALVTLLVHGDDEPSGATALVSSLMDTWLVLRTIETNGERNRLLFVRKARGSAHSNQVREFVMSDAGLDLVDVYVGPQGVLTGSARLSQEADERRAAIRLREDMDRRRREVASHTARVEAQIAALRAELEVEAAEFTQRVREDEAATADASTMARHRWADPSLAGSEAVDG